MGSFRHTRKFALTFYQGARQTVLKRRIFRCAFEDNKDTLSSVHKPKSHCFTKFPTSHHDIMVLVFWLIRLVLVIISYTVLCDLSFHRNRLKRWFCELETEYNLALVSKYPSVVNSTKSQSLRFDYVNGYQREKAVCDCELFCCLAPLGSNTTIVVMQTRSLSWW